MRYGFTIHHNGPDAKCVGRDHSRCIAFWNAVRDYHIDERGWSDIAYSFGACPHGVRFVGRGWDRAQFANGEDIVGPEDGSDAHWYTVLVFLGWHEEDGQPVDEEPTPEMVAGVRQLIAEGRSSERCGDRVLPHNAFKQKRCPGDAFTALAAAWDGKPLTTTLDPPEDDDVLTPEDKEWIGAMLTEVAGPRTVVNVADRSEVWKWQRETVLLARQQSADLAALKSAVSQLGAGGSIDYAKVKEAAAQAVAEAFDGVDGD